MSKTYWLDRNGEQKREWEALPLELGLRRGPVFHRPPMAGGVMSERKVVKPSAMCDLTFPRTQDSGRALRIEIAIENSLFESYRFFKTSEADLSLIGSRVLFHDISLFRSSFLVVS